MSSAFRASFQALQHACTRTNERLSLTSTVHAVRALLLGAVANRRTETDQGRLALLLLRLGDSVVDGFEVTACASKAAENP